MKHIINFDNYKVNESVSYDHMHPKFSDESKKILYLFTTKFLPTIIPNREYLTIGEYIGKLKGITTEDYGKLLGFYKDNGYPSPDPKILQFQKELMDITDVKTFTDENGKTKNFDDSKFGIVTGKTLVDWMCKSLAKTDQNETVAQMNATAEENARHAGKEVFAPKRKTAEDVKTNTGTQEIK